MLMGPQASAAEREEFRDRIIADPRRYIAQHRIELSTCPTWIAAERRLEPRRIDLRPFMLDRQARDSWVLPGGLTRVALRAGSYVVNSSQGGGSKDTWVRRRTPRRDLPRRRPLLLARALHRTRREHRAPAAGHARAGVRRRAAAAALLAAAGDRVGAVPRVRRALRRRRRRQRRGRAALHDLGAGEPGLHPQLDPRRARGGAVDPRGDRRTTSGRRPTSSISGS